MELFLLNENEIKIALTADDLETFDLSLESFDYDNTKTRKIMWDIFDKAKEKTGFDAASDRVYIRLYPKKCGGCVLYVKKIKNRVFLSGENSKPEKSSPVSVFGFDNYDFLYEACLILSRSGNYESSKLFKTNKNKFILMFTPENGNEENIAEFGSNLNMKYIHSFLKENCRFLITENAVKKIAEKS